MATAIPLLTIIEQHLLVYILLKRLGGHVDISSEELVAGIPEGTELIKLGDLGISLWLKVPGPITDTALVQDIKQIEGQIREGRGKE